MINADNLHEAEQQALGQLAQMDLTLAARLHALAMSAEEPKEIIEFTRSYQRAGRCLRQTIMLRSRLRQERERQLAAAAAHSRTAQALADLADDDEVPDPVELRIDRRIGDLQEAASRIVAAASPDMPRRERLDQLDRIDDWIDQDVEDKDEGFGLQDLDDHVVRLCHAAGLPDALSYRFRDLPRAPREEEDEDGDGEAGPYTFEPPRTFVPSGPNTFVSAPASQPQRRDTG